jgi:hypothetical protein
LLIKSEVGKKDITNAINIATKTTEYFFNTLNMFTPK